MAKDRTTLTYQYTNPHPNEIRSLADCVYRAISIATGKDWLTVYDELTTLGREHLMPPNDNKLYAIYLDKIGTRLDVKVNNKRLTGADVAKWNDGNTYIIRTAHHLAAIKDGKVRDTWNSSHKSGYIIWKLT